MEVKALMLVVLVIQRRHGGTQDFNNNWQVYKGGFGESEGELWLGNEVIHSLTSRRTYVLRVDLTNGDGDAAVAEYDSTWDKDSSRGRCTERWQGAWWYDWCLNSNLNGQLGHNANHSHVLWTSWTGMKPLKTVEMKIRPDHFKVAADCGDVQLEGDSLSYHKKKPFSTFDHDMSRGSCTGKWHGAWWYDWCLNSHLNGVYKNSSSWSYVIWDRWMGCRSLKFSEMKFRPANFKHGHTTASVYCDMTTSLGGWTVGNSGRSCFD
ncbi:hypothetical protein NP493_1064g00041 [Ridgeia piscesae]|uniref:Fibrinogen C-terminal domain-containing protein n=1 Tax=Ridgeia piscesae TaxID=27915 RepID=A0AAD9KJ22_RIDPI|nr:hypothetical protein NP493_1064g00041 [Ridgeia piscesae]